MRTKTAQNISELRNTQEYEEALSLLAQKSSLQAGLCGVNANLRCLRRISPKILSLAYRDRLIDDSEATVHGALPFVPTMSEAGDLEKYPRLLRATTTSTGEKHEQN